MSVYVSNTDIVIRIISGICFIIAFFGFYLDAKKEDKTE